VIDDGGQYKVFTLLQEMADALQDLDHDFIPLFLYDKAKSPSAALRSICVTAAYLPHPILLPEGEGIQFTLSLRERVARGRVRGPHSSYFASLASEAFCFAIMLLCFVKSFFLNRLSFSLQPLR
jgi:hypothetical protein